ncbi:MAG: metalloregulator ArsR/SmtB family transcription factor [Pseudomonadota bacterium]
MVDYKDSDLDRIFQSLSDPTRRALLARLTQGPCQVGELSSPFDMSLAAVSKHLKVLERSGLVRRQVRGRDHLLSLDPAGLRQAANWLEHHQTFWKESLDKLEAVLSAPCQPNSQEKGPMQQSSSKNSKSDKFISHPKSKR